MKKNIFPKIIFSLYIIAVLLLCFVEVGPFNNVRKELFNIPMDKIVHFLMFFPFPFLAYMSFGKFNKNPFHSFIFILGLFVFGCILAIGTELGQTLLKYRTGDVKDFLADGLALGISSVLVLIIDLRKQFKA